MGCIYSVIVLFYCRFAWLNPEGDCYAHLEGRHVSDIDDGESINVAEIFHTWFVDFLLVLTLIPIIAGIIAYLYFYH